ncbi:MAG TPA: hypothetical protein VLC07_01225 [Solirubrobacterales bacterium]|nr:hypothetical protein [Solirubrobacterales bacterium]
MRQATKLPVPIDDPAPNPDPAFVQAAQQRHLTVDPASFATVSGKGFRLSVAGVTSKAPAAGHGAGQDAAFAHLSAPGSKLPEGYYRVVAVADGTPEARMRVDLKNGIFYVSAGDSAPSPQAAAKIPWKLILRIIGILIEIILLFI